MGYIKITNIKTGLVFDSRGKEFHYTREDLYGNKIAEVEYQYPYGKDDWLDDYKKFEQMNLFLEKKSDKSDE